MLHRSFPQNDSEAARYNGFLKDGHTFCKLFDLKESFDKTLEEINVFLFDNGYCRLLREDFNEDLAYGDELLEVSKHGYKEQLVLCINKPKPTLHQVTQELTAFRDARDWEQFHNSKDLALAISIEAGELLELFLWKGNEDFKEEKLREELADVFSFCLLLAEKHGFDPLEIITSKIQKNAAKYPVAKAKGTAKKYNEL